MAAAVKKMMEKIIPIRKNNSIFRQSQRTMIIKQSLYLSGLEDYMLPCLNKKFLGVDCPGCGLQRSVGLLLQGEFLAAFQMFPAIFTLIPLFVLVLCSKVFQLKIDDRFIIVLAIASVALILINFIYKLTH